MTVAELEILGSVTENHGALQALIMRPVYDTAQRAPKLNNNLTTDIPMVITAGYQMFRSEIQQLHICILCKETKGRDYL